MAHVLAVEDMARIARQHRVHYDVTPEVIIKSEGRTAVGYEIRLFAVHEKGARAVPGCPKCVDLVRDLRPIAEWLVPDEHRPTLAGIEPFHPSLYDSKEVPGTDEVALSIRLTHREGYDRPVDACEQRCLKEIRERLKVLGIRER
jgi:hypothetical protein